MSRILYDTMSAEQEFGKNQNEWFFGETGEYQGTSMEHEEALQNMEQPGMEQYGWSFNDDGEFQRIVNEYGDAQNVVHSVDVETLKEMNSMGGKLIDKAVEKELCGYSFNIGSALADRVNSDPKLLDKQVAIGKNSAQAMMGMNGTVPIGQDIIDNIHHDSQQFTEISEINPLQFEGQISFADNENSSTLTNQLNSESQNMEGGTEMPKISHQLKEFRQEHGEPGTTSPAAVEHEKHVEGQSTVRDKLNELRNPEQGQGPPPGQEPEPEPEQENEIE